MKALRAIIYGLALAQFLTLCSAIWFKIKVYNAVQEGPAIYRELRKSVERAYELAPDIKGGLRVDVDYYDWPFSGETIRYDITVDADDFERQFAYYDGLVKFIKEEAEEINFRDYFIEVHFNIMKEYRNSVIEFKNTDLHDDIRHDDFYMISISNINESKKLITSDTIKGIKKAYVFLYEKDVSHKNSDYLVDEFLAKLVDIQSVQIHILYDDEFQYIIDRIAEKYPWVSVGEW